MKKNRLIIMLIVLAILLMGNVAPPWIACDNKHEGDPCNLGYGCSLHEGFCTRWKDCQDNPNTTVNECFICQEK